MIFYAAGQNETLFNMFGHGYFIVTYGKRHAGNQEIAVCNLYRMANEKNHLTLDEQLRPVCSNNRAQRPTNKKSNLANAIRYSA